jgi:hypothetical protein
MGGFVLFILARYLVLLLDPRLRGDDNWQQQKNEGITQVRSPFLRLLQAKLKVRRGHFHWPPLYEH